MLFSYYKRPLFILTVLYALLIIAFRPWFERRAAGDTINLPLYDAEVEGVIKEYPIKHYKLWRMELETTSVDSRPLKTEVMAYTGDLGGASLGDTVIFRGDLKKPFSNVVPGNLDWPRYLSRRGINTEARGGAFSIKRKASFALGKAADFRRAALAVFDLKLSSEAASVAGGVVIGEKKNISPGLKTAFQDSGSMHLLVASGSNVGFVVIVVYFLCAGAGLKKRHSWPLALLSAGFYVMAAGFDPPLTRAYFMFGSGLAALLLERRPGIFQGLVIACLLILAFEPLALFDAGFQMSFAAAYGLSIGMTLWGERLRFKGLTGILAGLFAVSFFAQAGLYPLMAYYFHKISLVSLVSNIVLVPASGVIMALGFLLVFSSKISVLYGLFSVITQRALDLFILFIRFFAGFYFSAVRVSEPSAWSAAAFFVLVFIFLHAPLFNFKKKPVWAMFALALLLFGCGKFFPSRPGASLFSDGKSAAFLFRAGDGGLFLVNAGLSGAKLSNAVLSSGERELKGVFLPSLDENDSSGLEELGNLIRVRRLFLPYGPLPDGLNTEIEQLSKKGTVILKLWPGESVLLDDIKVSAAWPCYARGGEKTEAAPGYTGFMEESRLSFVFSSRGGDAEVCSGGRQVFLQGRAFEEGGRFLEAPRGASIEVPL
ncbi:MAG: ComEC/Rec2 family competence protein [Elusimicrobia bacterium]|nr:ComEC/Rec2 family competence protein [Elusimicrobiota bacterium]